MRVAKVTQRSSWDWSSATRRAGGEGDLAARHLALQRLAVRLGRALGGRRQDELDGVAGGHLPHADEARLEAARLPDEIGAAGWRLVSAAGLVQFEDAARFEVRRADLDRRTGRNRVAAEPVDLGALVAL